MGIVRVVREGGGEGGRGGEEDGAQVGGKRTAPLADVDPPFRRLFGVDKDALLDPCARHLCVVCGEERG